ncbi:hypothetical protein WISP_93484 [Willisornis vidua]|uniref:Reverse transcriptase domain-containing protein n=1 Tax=Willisornis vidua TaxID=1566151 RepID=A0ABQ9D5K3_9PASS|nr:hypothetical protein WISP_93484 [Willisornis vidua]
MLKDNKKGFKYISCESKPMKKVDLLLNEVIEQHILDVISKQVKEKVITSQCGFTKEKSCLINLNAFYDGMAGWIDEERAVDIVHLDFSKAVGNVSHNTFMESNSVEKELEILIGKLLTMSQQCALVAKKKALGYNRKSADSKLREVILPLYSVLFQGYSSWSTVSSSKPLRHGSTGERYSMEEGYKYDLGDWSISPIKKDRGSWTCLA